MYSEIKPGTAEKQELARQAFVKALKDNPKLSKDACWAKAKQDNPKLFGDLQAADWMADDEAEEREREDHETHGAFQTSAPSQRQFSLADHMALFAKLQGPKKVEATQQEEFICVGASQIRFSKSPALAIRQSVRPSSQYCSNW